METQILLKTSVNTGKLVQYRSPTLTKLGYRVCSVFYFLTIYYMKILYLYTMYFDHIHILLSSSSSKKISYHASLFTSWFSYFNPLSPFNAVLTSMEVVHPLESIRGHINEEIILSFSQRPENDNSFSNRDGLVLNFDLFQIWCYVFTARGKNYIIYTHIYNIYF